MQFKTVFKVIGYFLVFLSIIMLFPTGLAFYDQSLDFIPFVKSLLCTLTTGTVFILFNWNKETFITPKEGFTIVTFSWVIMTAFSALPFYFSKLSGDFQFSYTDSFFEAMSGLTTTGSSIITNIEGLPRGLLLWRSLTHWIGGMGIIVLFLAILPAFGAGGFQLFRAEIPGPSKDKLSPKIGNTAKTLSAVYLGLSIICFLCYLYFGMNWFDAICHAFSTIATGGFSTKNNSIAYWNSWQLDYTITFFMFLSGCNFILYLHFLKGKRTVFFKNSEFKLFLSFIIFGTIMIITAKFFAEPNETLLHSIRDSIFAVVSVITSTGFATADYDQWPLLCHMIILILMCTGACAGSTGGGIKVFRVFIIFKVGVHEITQLLNPRAVHALKMDGQGIHDRLLRVILGFVCLYVITLGFFTLIIVGIEGDKHRLISLASICISCLSNIGPGLGSLGPTDNYSNLSDTTKWCLVFLMLLGRLELYSVLALFHRSLWRR